MHRAEKLVSIAIFLILIPAVSWGASRIEVKGPWILEVPPVSSVAAVYMVIENNGDQDDRLITISTEASGHAEIHTTLVDEKSVVSMKKSEFLDIPSGSIVELEPGGSHIMLIGLKKPVKAGDRIELDLRFEKFGIVRVKAPVKAMNSNDTHNH